MRAGVEHQGFADKYEAAIENIGFGGARLALAEYASADDILIVSLTAPSLWDPLVLRGRVVWVRAGETARAKARAETKQLVGLAFEHQNPRAVLALHELIAALFYE